MCLIGQVVPSLFLLVNDYYIIKATKKKTKTNLVLKLIGFFYYYITVFSFEPSKKPRQNWLTQFYFSTPSQGMKKKLSVLFSGIIETIIIHILTQILKVYNKTKITRGNIC